MLNEKMGHEAALESFVVAAWQEADSRDTSTAWFRVYEQLVALQAYLSRLHLEPLARTANDLKVLAILRGEMCPDYAPPTAFRGKPAAIPQMHYAF